MLKTFLQFCMFCRYSSILQDRAIPPTSSEVFGKQSECSCRTSVTYKFQPVLDFFKLSNEVSVFFVKKNMAVTTSIFCDGFLVRLNFFTQYAIIAVMNTSSVQMNCTSFTFLSLVNGVYLC